MSRRAPPASRPSTLTVHIGRLVVDGALMQTALLDAAALQDAIASQLGGAPAAPQAGGELAATISCAVADAVAARVGTERGGRDGGH